MKPSQDTKNGKSYVIELELIAAEATKRKNNKWLFFTLSKVKLISEHIARKCKIPKKIKLFLSRKKVAPEITVERIINFAMRLVNLALNLFDKVSSFADIPAIVMKLMPIRLAITSPTPCVTSLGSIKPK